ncbi:MAG: ABC transporter ATP-binding protein [Oscillospiraceae bacterium]|nr:ABC transporter ATP-binding protein [Oscillospiraceae bacterium]
MEPKIEFSHVTKIFQTRSQEIVAVKDYSMQIQQGEFVAILGPSGCGKSTLIRMLDGIIDTTEGDIFIDGKKVNNNKKMPMETLRKMGFIFQQPNLLPWYTVRQNIALPLSVFGLKGKEWEDRVDELMKMVDLQDYADAHPNEISGGMLQRAGVIRAMVHDPEILLMDEPFGALDELSREQMNMELLDIWGKTKKTIIFITHNIEEAVLLASKVYVMGTHPGRLVETVDLELPRPRTLSMITQPDFIAYKSNIESLIGEIDLSKIK